MLPFEAFNKRTDGGKQTCVTYCKQCEREKYLENKDEIREIRRRQRIGVPIGTYNYLVAEYGAECAICKTKNPGGTSKESGQFHIDHDHETGAIRGLLCGTCNVGIGMLKHDTQLLLSAIKYLARQGHSIEELRNFLKVDKFDNTIIDSTLNDLDL